MRFIVHQKLARIKLFFVRLSVLVQFIRLQFKSCPALFLSIVFSTKKTCNHIIVCNLPEVTSDVTGLSLFPIATKRYKIFLLRTADNATKSQSVTFWYTSTPLKLNFCDYKIRCFFDIKLLFNEKLATKDFDQFIFGQSREMKKPPLV